MKRLAVLCLLFAGPLCWGQSVVLPKEVRVAVNEWAPVPADWDGGSPKWYTPDPGLEVVDVGKWFPPDVEKNLKVRVFKAATPGRYRVIAYNAKGDVASDKAECIVIVGDAPPLPPPGTPVPPGTPPVLPGPVTERATAATYVYEKDQHAIPNQVLSALNRLNRERKIIATVLEADTKSGTGDVPAQYKVPLAAAKEAGLPALVVTAGDKVLVIVKDPKTEQAVLDAVAKGAVK